MAAVWPAAANAQQNGNLTGVTSLGAELSAKRIELASELVPKGAGVALLVNLDNPTPRSSSRTRRQRPEVSGCCFTSCAQPAQTTLAQQRTAALVVGSGGLSVGSPR
jgi:hypothetical protein